MSGDTVLINLPTGHVFDVNGTPRAMLYTACIAWSSRAFYAGAAGRRGTKVRKQRKKTDWTYYFFSLKKEKNLNYSSRAVVLNWG